MGYNLCVDDKDFISWKLQQFQFDLNGSLLSFIHRAHHDFVLYCLIFVIICTYQEYCTINKFIKMASKIAGQQ